MTYACAITPCQRTSAGCHYCDQKPMYGIHAQPWPPITTPIYPQPIGCICPPTSEKTCENPHCPRHNPFKLAQATIQKAHDTESKQ